MQFFVKSSHPWTKFHTVGIENQEIDLMVVPGSDGWFSRRQHCSMYFTMVKSKLRKQSLMNNSSVFKFDETSPPWGQHSLQSLSKFPTRSRKCQSKSPAHPVCLLGLALIGALGYDCTEVVKSMLLGNISHKFDIC